MLSIASFQRTSRPVNRSVSINRGWAQSSEIRVELSFVDGAQLLVGSQTTYNKIVNVEESGTDFEMTDNFQHIKFTIDDRVARITFARPPLNIFNISMMREINDALTQCAQQRELAAIVFDAAADCNAFSAGVAVEEHVEETIFQMLDSFHGIFRNLEQIARPTLAVVDGAALGGGCELVAACDIVIASERARFGQPEIKLGVLPPVAAVLLPQVIGDKRARELILTGELIEAPEAARLGLVNYLLPVGELEQKTSELLSRFRNLSVAALAFTKEAIDLGRGRSLDSALKEVEDLYLNELMKTHDASEGIKAFTEKRKPEWRHR
jgi:cyclohexa-1,5-dienecarbonyl-CoA hydratase